MKTVALQVARPIQADLPGWEGGSERRGLSPPGQARRLAASPFSEPASGGWRTDDPGGSIG